MKHGGLRLGAVLASGVLGLLGAEWAVRIGGWAPVPPPVLSGEQFHPHPDPVLRFVNAAGSSYSLEFTDSPQAPARVIEAHVNEDGFRGPRVEPAKRPGVSRIICIGDSHTFGHGVRDDETWPAALGRELQAAGWAVEVINAGVNAYDAEQELRYLELEVLSWQPDLVLWQYFINDVAMRGLELEAERQPGRLLRLTDPQAEGWIASLRSVSRAADAIVDRIHNGLRLEYYAEARQGLYDPDHEAWQRTCRALESAHELCAERGIHFGLILFPYLRARDGGLASDSALLQVARHCERLGIPCLDLSPLYWNQDAAALRVHPRDYHANAEAYAIAARATAAWIRAALARTDLRESASD